MASIIKAPVFDTAVYAGRRARLMAKLPENSVLLVSSATEITRSRDTEFAFRQDSDFNYLTGFPEPDALLILQKSASGEITELLLCRPKDELAEIWQGRRFGPEQAAQQFALPAVSNEQLTQEVQNALNQKTTLVYSQGLYSKLDDLVSSTLATLRNYPKKGYLAPSQQLDLRPIIAELRLFKDEAEIGLLQQACKISADAHKQAMRQCKAGMWEFQLEAIIRHHFAMQGAREPGYNTIVGGGENGCILHYTDNNAELQHGDLVLIDAGGELAGYTADITRTFPVSGKFSPEQAALYQVVLNAQYAACAAVKPGNSTKDTVAAAIFELTKGLLELGILQGELEALIKEQACKKYFIHGLGHWLGLDVHDVGAYKVNDVERPFEPGMVLTIEPGLYIPKGSACEQKWWGLAVRIEDDLLVIKDGHLNLTDTAPKEIAAIEALMAGLQ
ncbi:Xaa-Pro aminopeptidase [Rheinheimera sp. 4Y26]|uniref:Xaa-Pro aminopeptidase n=1 Tax=Rheinheimera sp. 4Y26 TaxID=2977811 RepID=UPI0021B0A159|nr:Xaa-Pro aminopeptidase [Rheinheimera sp. 4Y26]MCT6700337.1 Xaa-Pro aminopeptidase [Rheinheimera sp. 4Y26]